MTYTFRASFVQEMQADLVLEKGIEIKQSEKRNKLGAGRSTSNDKEAAMHTGRGGSGDLRGKLSGETMGSKFRDGLLKRL